MHYPLLTADETRHQSILHQLPDVSATLPRRKMILLGISVIAF